MRKANQLIRDPSHQAEYGRQVLDWTEQSLRFFSVANWEQEENGGPWRCLQQFPPPERIAYRACNVSLQFDLCQLAVVVSESNKPNALIKTRQHVLRIAGELLREASVEDRKQLKQLRQRIEKA